MADLDKVKRNVAKMVSQGAPEDDIDSYLGGEGVTVDQVRAHKVGAPVAAPATEKPTSQALGFLQGVTKPLDNAATALESGLRRVGVPVDAMADAVGLPTSAAAQQQRKEAIANSGYAPGGVGRFAGEVIGTAPIALATTNPVAAGALSGAALTDSGDAEGVAKDAALGGVGGKIGDLAIRGLSRVISPAVSPYVRKLIDEGAQLTPGQILGGGFKRVEDGLKSIPLIGDMIGNAQNNSIKSINKVAAGRALAPIGQTVPANIEAGSALTSHVSDELGGAYDRLLPKMSVQMDPQLTSDIATAQGSNLTPSYAGQLQSIVDTQLGRKLGNGPVSGSDLQGIGSELRRQAKGYAADPSFDARELGGAVSKVGSAFDDALARQNPSYAQELSDINRGYANYARIRQAGSSVGAKEGVFTPAQLNAAVKAGDKSAGKGNFAKGDALMQDLSTAADQVVSSKVNDSGTPYRLAVGAGLTGGAAYLHPASLVASLGAMAAYSKPGLKALQVALTERPQAAQAIADLIRKGNRAGAVAAANALVGITATQAEAAQ